MVKNGATNLEEGVDLDGGLGDTGEGALGALASAAETAKGTGVVGDVELGLLLELLLEVLEESVVEVLSSKMRVSSGRLDGEDATSDGKEGHIERSSSEVEDEDELLLLALLGSLSEAVRDRGRGGLVDDTQDVEASDRSSVLRSSVQQPK